MLTARIVATFVLALVCPFVSTVSLSAPTTTAADARRERAKLEEKDFDNLSDQDLSERAKLALETDGTKWRHGETDHFVYHFQRMTEAQKLAREAEFYYWKIKDDLAVTKDLAEGKSHVVIFSKADQWQRFAAEAQMPQWTVGFAAGRELFLLAEAGSTEASDRMAHEMTHLVFYRFVPKRVPLWLNEGFAEYESKAAYAKLKGIGNAPQPHSGVPPMDLERLTSLREYPENPYEVMQFYKESERLVRFLITRHPKESFVPFVNLLADGATFEEALLKTYGPKYKKLDDFKKLFDRF